MRCLFLTPFVPYPPIDGGRVRVLGLIDALAGRCDVDILAFADREEDSDAVESLRAHGHSVEAIFGARASALTVGQEIARGGSLLLAKYRSRSFADALASRVQRYDIVQCEFPYTGQFRLHAPPSKAKWVLDAHNVEHVLSHRLERTVSSAQLFYRLYARRETAARRREELAICRRMDAIVTASEPDAAAIAELVPGADPVVIPNGVHLSEAAPSGQGEAIGPCALFVGKLDYRPNVDALRWFVDAILPRILRALPDFELVVVGSGNPNRVAQVIATRGVRFVGRVDDVVPYLQEAWVLVAPLRAGSGTRLKILEALAARRPVVTTPIGHEGLSTVANEHVLVASDASDFAECVVRLCRDRELRVRLGNAGRALAESDYGWEHAGELLAALFGRLVAEKDAVAR